MPTVVTKSIGTASRDYSTVQAWVDDWPTNLVSLDQVWRGVMYNDSPFTAGAFAGEGYTTDLTRYFELTVAAGHSFQDFSRALDLDLVAAWELEESSGTRNDSKGSSHLTNHSINVTTGRVGNAGRFNHDGAGGVTTGQYLSCASNSALQMGNIDFTLAVWFYLVHDQDGVLIGKDSDSPASSRDYTLDYRQITNSARFYVNGGGGGLLVEASGIALNMWHFVVAWHDAAADTLNIQLNNGTVVSVSTGGTAPQVSSAEFRIGARIYSGFEGWFQGNLDQPMLWKRKLSVEERTELFTGMTYAQVDSRVLTVRDSFLGTFDPTKGVTVTQSVLYGSVFDLRPAHVRMSRLQVKNTAGSGFAISNGANPAASPHHVITDCIGIASRNGQPVMGITRGEFVNCIAVNHLWGNGFSCETASSCTGCLALSPTDVASTAAGYKATYGGGRLTSCASFGFASPTASASAFDSSSSHNATDCASGLPGTSNQHSVPFSRTTPFVDADKDSLDLRTLVGTVLEGNGVLDSAIGPSDVSGYLRRVSAVTIGPWETQPGVTRDAVTDGGSVNATSSSWNHTCSGNNRYLKVSLKIYGTDDLTSVTYDGVAMARLDKATMLTEGSHCIVYGLTGPALGTHAVQVNRTAANYIVGVSVSYKEVAQSGQPEDTGIAAAGDYAISPSVAAGADARLVGACVASYTGTELVAKAAGTVEVIEAAAGGLVGLLAAYESASSRSAGTQSLTFGQGSSTGDLAGVVASLLPVPLTVGGDLDVSKAEALTVTDAVTAEIPAPPLPVAPGVQRHFLGTPHPYLTGSVLVPGANIAATYDNTTDPVVPYAPLAQATLLVTGFSATPLTGAKVELWAATENDTDGLTGARFLGEFLLDDVNAAQVRTIIVSMAGVERITVYAVNNTGVDINIGMSLTLTPLSYGVTV